MKKPKLEIQGEEEHEKIRTSEQREEVALEELILNQTKEVESLRERIVFYKSQLDEAVKRLEDTKRSLSQLRKNNVIKGSKQFMDQNYKVKVEEASGSPIQISDGSSECLSLISEGSSGSRTPPQVEALHQKEVIMKFSGDWVKVENSTDVSVHEKGNSSQQPTKPKVKIVIPAIPLAMKRAGPGKQVSDSKANESQATYMDKNVDIKSCIPLPEHEIVEKQPKGTKRKADHNEHKSLIPLVGNSSSAKSISCQSICLLPSQHKRKLRSLVLSPTNDQLFITSSLDGAVNLWQIQRSGSSAELLSTTSCLSDKQRRWPEDIAWHPEGDEIFSVYSAEGEDSQISITKLNKGKKRPCVSFLEHKPHVKGIISSIIFTPWDNKSFVTGGSDHAVVLWKDKGGEDSWKPKVVHANCHSSAVMGVAGMSHKKVVLSAGADKRIVGFDVIKGTVDFKYQIESKCMSVLPNPCDFNLFMVQTGTPDRQLKLFDLRSSPKEIHTFGWKQQSSESQSALISQSWSPDGLYLTSGSADPAFHIFDIRYKAQQPSQSIRAHHKRVFKAAWHQNLPLLISISSDLNIGLHRIT